MIIQFMRSFPVEMEEAAVMDGCNSLQVLWHVVVPVILPAIISVALFQFMWSMNDFLSPLIYLSSVEKYPVALALKLSIDVTEATSWNQILAMSTIALAPSLILFFAAQKYFVEGITVGSVKGGGSYSCSAVGLPRLPAHSRRTCSCACHGGAATKSIARTSPRFAASKRSIRTSR
jgi:hypothetical protein